MSPLGMEKMGEQKGGGWRGETTNFIDTYWRGMLLLGIKKTALLNKHV